MIDLKQFASALNQISEEKGISSGKVLTTIEMALAAAYKKEYGEKGQIVRAKFNPNTGSVKFFQIKTVVDELMLKPEDETDEGEPSFTKDTEGEEDKKIRFNEERHIMLDEAKKIKNDIAIGDEMEFALEAHEDFGRIAAQTAKQVIIQRIREAEREAVWEEYKDKEGELVSGIIQRMEMNNIFVDLGRTVAIFPREEQIFNEKYYIGARVKFFVLSVNSDPKGPGIVLSRSHPKMVSRLFELEVPEIGAGAVEIKSIAREAGSRTKIAVFSNEEGIDSVGSCIGQKGTRVGAVLSEIGGEKIDIIEWAEDPEIFISNAMSPAKVTKIEVMPNRHTAKVYVPEDQLSLAIGKAGQNVRLAAKLTGWKIDVAGATVTVEGVKEGKGLEDLEGVGEKTANALRAAGFNTPEEIAKASVEELTEVEGVGAKTAEKILESAKKLLE
ncbi:MAG: NusA antitermination factor [Candidatus Azambacteria bacterium GW2011_GWE1_42_9]|nr:MAG: NusA antitermination factor [Candidatus Azambacteria bacterium GW2011_GWF1_41_10]KKS49477.1 MAG: NusA antitermination factor [Candidatus Azambacteria bacterium GW2011_GWF2_42_22]KKS79339.1 MAG: NusA antitermination factor [Candidatus Azambacteria bacterium GW2011_GWE1_42_9]KKT03588.1 MAG: NusA antitermination factor [Candidatus Azambacteria bacterium GW2011_GWD1_43_18]KKT12742.1 MAG: NusA antitermination factor [Candidatus Azambacteria bacterium GW2011_GWC2_43_27]HCQ63489.1 transcripti